MKRLIAFLLLAASAHGADAPFGDIPANLNMSTSQSVRRNAANTAFEAYLPGTGGGPFPWGGTETGHGDSNYTILNTDKIVFTNAVFTGAHTWTLPAASTVAAGYAISVIDQQGTVSTTNTLTIQKAAATSDLIYPPNTSSYIISSNFQGVTLVSDGISKWHAISVQPGGNTGTSGVFAQQSWTPGVYAGSLYSLPTSIGASGKMLQSNGSNVVFSAPTWPTGASGTGKIIRDNGTNYVETTAAYPDTAVTNGNVLTVSGGNWVEAAPAAGGGVSSVSGTAPITVSPTTGATVVSTSMATDSILGRATTGTGVAEVLSSLPFAFTGDVTRPADSNAQTLATVNSNVGSFTNANITVNGKGLITAAANGTVGGTIASTSNVLKGDGAGNASASDITTGSTTYSLNKNSNATEIFSVSNTTNGTASRAALTAVSDSASLNFQVTATLFTPSGLFAGKDVSLFGQADRLIIGTDANTHPIQFSTDGGLTEVARILTGLMVGTTTDPGAGKINVATGYRIGNAAGSGKILKGDGTNFVASTETYAAPGTSGNVMTSDGTNWTSAAPASGGAGTGLSYITKVSEATLSNEFALGSLATGLLKNTTTTGVPTIAAAGTDYADLAFKTFSVSGQSDVVADTAADTMTYVAGTNMTITTNAATDTITFASSGGGGGPFPWGGSETGHGDTNYTILNTDKIVYTNAAFTAARTWTLPAASTVTAGYSISVMDKQGTLTTTNNLTVQRTGSDLIFPPNAAQYIMTGAYQAATFVSDGVSHWDAISVQPGAGGGSTAGYFSQTSWTAGVWAGSLYTLPLTIGTSGKIIQSNGTNAVFSGPTWPTGTAGAGKIIRDNGTNFVQTTAAYPDTAGTVENRLVSDGTNWNSVAQIRANTTASATSWTPNFDTFDQEAQTALAGNITAVNAPTWTNAADGKRRVLRLKANGSGPYTIGGWNAIYRVIGTTLPLSIAANKTIYIGIIYNALDTKCDVVAVSTEL